ncbi:MAG TPA: hypothetical protein VM869_21665 [Enhygromyxa sp.]|nr:hypothetical protein [Enhygromyxa sp.]
MRGFPWLPLALFAGTFALAIACHDDDDPEYVGQPCESPADCYPAIEDPSLLAGEVECLDKVEGGYCTHLCEVDADCCAVEGECVSGYPQVCAPFENQPDKRCFLSCEDSDVGELGPDEYCRTYAHPSFGCRSTGGGSENRKVCVP